MESIQPDKMEWTTPVLQVLNMDATEGGSVESTKESDFVFPFS